MQDDYEKLLVEALDLINRALRCGANELSLKTKRFYHIRDDKMYYSVSLRFEDSHGNKKFLKAGEEEK